MSIPQILREKFRQILDKMRFYVKSSDISIIFLDHLSRSSIQFTSEPRTVSFHAHLNFKIKLCITLQFRWCNKHTLRKNQTTFCPINDQFKLFLLTSQSNDTFDQALFVKFVPLRYGEPSYGAPRNHSDRRSFTYQKFMRVPSTGSHDADK